MRPITFELSNINTKGKNMLTKILPLFLIPFLLFAADKNYGNATVEEVTSIYDGDTFRCNIQVYPAIIGERMGIRIAGIDTPEM